MSDLLAALALVMVVEGSLFALAPNLAKRAAASVAASPEDALRWGGALLLALGVGLLWMNSG